MFGIKKEDERYEGDPIVVDEGDSSTWHIQAAIRPVFFRNSSNEAADWDLLRSTLQVSRTRLSVKRVCLDSTSRMAEAQLLPLFPEVDTVDVWNRAVKDLFCLTRLTCLRRLALLGQPDCVGDASHHARLESNVRELGTYLVDSRSQGEMVGLPFGLQLMVGATTSA